MFGMQLFRQGLRQQVGWIVSGPPTSIKTKYSAMFQQRSMLALFSLRPPSLVAAFAYDLMSHIQHADLVQQLSSSSDTEDISSTDHSTATENDYISDGSTTSEDTSKFQHDVDFHCPRLSLRSSLRQPT